MGRVWVLCKPDPYILKLLNYPKCVCMCVCIYIYIYIYISLTNYSQTLISHSHFSIILAIPSPQALTLTKTPMQPTLTTSLSLSQPPTSHKPSLLPTSMPSTPLSHGFVLHLFYSLVSFPYLMISNTNNWL